MNQFRFSSCKTFPINFNFGLLNKNLQQHKYFSLANRFSVFPFGLWFFPASCSFVGKLSLELKWVGMRANNNWRAVLLCTRCCSLGKRGSNDKKENVRLLFRVRFTRRDSEGLSFSLNSSFMNSFVEEKFHDVSRCNFWFIFFSREHFPFHFDMKNFRFDPFVNASTSANVREKAVRNHCISSNAFH